MNTTGRRRTPARFMPSWVSPRAEAPSPNQVRATRFSSLMRRADVLGAHRRRDAHSGGLVPAPGIEASGDLPLLVEDVATLFDPAREQHVTVDPEQVLAVEARLLDLRQRADWLCFPGDGHAGSNCSRSTRVEVWARPPTGCARSGA